MSRRRQDTLGFCYKSFRRDSDHPLSPQGLGSLTHRGSLVKKRVRSQTSWHAQGGYPHRTVLNITFSLLKNSQLLSFLRFLFPLLWIRPHLMPPHSIRAHLRTDLKPSVTLMSEFAQTSPIIVVSLPSPCPPDSTHLSVKTYLACTPNSLCWVPLIVTFCTNLALN